MTPGQAPKDPQAASNGGASRKVRICACEDSALMREYIVTGLAHFGIPVLGVSNGQDLDKAMEEQEPDIVILDIGLPGEDGYSIAERLRSERPQVGIIMLTARDQVDDRVKGLDCGADLYFAKPVDMRELASAIGSLHRRLSVPVAQGDNWRLDALKSCLVTPAGVSIELTDNELRFLIPLLERPGVVVDREELLRALEQRSDIYAMRRLETMVSRLRTKVQKASPDEPLPVRARHGRGYVFLSEVAQEL
jgi:DNA-binding response OmpR family regulator